MINKRREIVVIITKKEQLINCFNTLIIAGTCFVHKKVLLQQQQHMIWIVYNSNPPFLVLFVIPNKTFLPSSFIIVQLLAMWLKCSYICCWIYSRIQGPYLKVLLRMSLPFFSFKRLEVANQNTSSLSLLWLYYSKTQKILTAIISSNTCCWHFINFRGWVITSKPEGFDETGQEESFNIKP